MSEHLITPPEKLDLPADAPLIFLAGPVQGAKDWQDEFAAQLLNENQNLYIASPRRTPENQQKFDADEQVAWEHAALERARKLGVLAFWWAAQNPNDVSYPAGRAYAQTTRIEFGKACGWKQFQPELPLIVGYSPNYKRNGGGSEDYIRREAAAYSLPIYDSRDGLLYAVTAAVRKLQQ